jgi:hypothetical protein
MVGLYPGQVISAEGYDVVATATVFEGGGPYSHVTVLNNNSSHYLVVLTTIACKDVVFIDSYKYHSDEDVREAYTLALHRMIAEAKEL